MKRDDGSARDEGRDPVLAPLLDEYHLPPGAPPLDALWARMEGEVAAAIVGLPARDELARRRAARARRAAGWAAALAASFVIGIAVGRVSGARTETVPAAAPVATAPAPPADAPAEAGQVFHAAAARHFGASGRRLAAVEAELRRGRVPPDVDRWAAGLLLETRILLHGPAGRDPRLAPLLRDLEAALAEVSALSDAGGAADAALTGRTLDRGRVVARLREAARVEERAS